MTQNPEATKYGRCRVLAKSTGKQCGRAAVGEHGVCDIHGGKSLKGKENGNFKHGLFSDYLDEEDRQTIEILEDVDDDEKLEELINWRLARLRRAVKAMQDPGDQRTFWEAFDELVSKTGNPEPDQIKELARMLSYGTRAMQDEIELVRKLIESHNKIAEGEDINLGWREALASGGQ